MFLASKGDMFSKERKGKRRENKECGRWNRRKKGAQIEEKKQQK